MNIYEFPDGIDKLLEHEVTLHGCMVLLRSEAIAGRCVWHPGKYYTSLCDMYTFTGDPLSEECILIKMPGLPFVVSGSGYETMGDPIPRVEIVEIKGTLLVSDIEPYQYMIDCCQYIEMRAYDESYRIDCERIEECVKNEIYNIENDRYLTTKDKLTQSLIRRSKAY